MAVWVRIMGVPIEYFNVWAMRKIGSVLGKLLKIDVNTNSQYRGKFARICVEIDVTKPLEAFIQINDRWYNLEYEGMPKICFGCGRYGHKRESCPWSVDPMAEKVDGGENESNMMNMDEPIVKAAQSSDDGSRFSVLNGEDKSLNEGNVGSGTDGEKGEGSIERKIWGVRKKKEASDRDALADISNCGGKPSAHNLGQLRQPLVRRSSSSSISNVEDQPFKFNVNAFKTDMYYGSNMSKGTYIFGHQPSNASGSDVELVACDLDPGEEMMNTDHTIPVWNSRGAGCTKFKDNVAELINIHQMEILVICEPRISGQNYLTFNKQ
ncbi:hypothetical protein ACFX15_039269 [Malus domestica]